MCPIIKHLILSPDSLRRFCPRTIREECRQLLNRLEYVDKLLHKDWNWQDLAKRLRNDIFHRSRLCRAPNSKKLKMALSLELSGILWWNFAYTLVLTRCSKRDCQMPFGIGQSFAEVQIQILKKWNWSNLLNLLVYFHKSLHTHYYWHDLDRGIVKYGSRDCKMIFYVGRGCAELQILKKWKWQNWVDYCDEILHTHWYLQDVAQEIVKYHLGLSEALPRFKFWKTVKLALSLKTFLNILIKFCYTLILTRARQRDCQMSFIISRGYAEVQILKTSKTDPLSWNFRNSLICSYPNSEKSKTEMDITHFHL